MKNVIVTSIIILSGFNLTAQNNLSIHYGYYGSVAGSKFFPSTLQLDSSRFQIALDYNLYFSNKAISYFTIEDLLTKTEIEDTYIDDFINDLEETNEIDIGQDLLILGLGLRTTIKDKEVDWLFTTTDRMSAFVSYQKALLQLAWKGNSQFQGQEINLSPELAGRYFREFALGAATEVLSREQYQVRAGVKVKYLHGLSSVYLDQVAARVFTAEKGREIDFNYNYRLRASGINDFSFLQGKGSGLGADIGVSLLSKSGIRLDWSLNDIGNIRWKDDILSVSDQGQIRYRGLSEEEFEDFNVLTDSIRQLITEVQTNDEPFRQAIGERMFLQASYLWKTEHRATRFFVTYVQGFRELPGVTTVPRVTLGANREVGRFLTYGINASYGGFTRLALGGNIGIVVNGFRFGIHTEDFTGFVLPKQGTGIGIGFMLQYSFRIKR
jgi:hypothetical protein